MKFGIVGLGNHATARVMPAVSEAGHKITAIYSRNIEKARKEGLRYNSIPFDSLETFFTKGDTDAIYIASPNFMHYDQTKMALSAGKHVLLEKQMTLKNEHAEELVKISEKEKLTLCVGFHLRFHPAVNEVRKAISKGELGEIIHVSGMWAGPPSGAKVTPDTQWWKEDEKVGGGSIMATGVHVIDTINYVLGRVPERVSAFRNPKTQIIEKTQQVNLDYRETTAEAISSRAISHPLNNLTIFGTNGTLTATGVFSVKVESSLIRDGRKLKDYIGVNMYREEVRAFVKAIQGEENMIARGTDGYNVVKIVNAAFRSDSENIITEI